MPPPEAPPSRCPPARDRARSDESRRRARPGPRWSRTPCGSEPARADPWSSQAPVLRNTGAVDQQGRRWRMPATATTSPAPIGAPPRQCRPRGSAPLKSPASPIDVSTVEAPAAATSAVASTIAPLRDIRASTASAAHPAGMASASTKNGQVPLQLDDGCHPGQAVAGQQAREQAQHRRHRHQRHQRAQVDARRGGCEASRPRRAARSAAPRPSPPAPVRRSRWAAAGEDENPPSRT